MSRRCKQAKLDSDILKDMKSIFPNQSFNDITKISWLTYKKLIQNGTKKK